MRLEYKILWFEDNDVSYLGKSEMVQEIVEQELGFKFLSSREKDSQNIENLKLDDYDLMIVDLSLANNEKGSNIVKKIRDLQIYTEVVFYSSDGEKAVRNALKDLELDGAYCSGRDDDDFVDKVKKVISTTIKKVQDLNNMRGLIMSETSEIDMKMLEIVKKVKGLNGLGVRLTDSIFENVGEKVKIKKGQYDDCFGRKNVDKIIKDNVLFDSSEKIKAVQCVFDLIDHDISTKYKGNVFKDEYSKITKRRNLLGHEPQKNEAGKILVGKGDDAFEFDDNFCIDMRKKVREYGEDLDKFIEHLNSLH